MTHLYVNMYPPSLERNHEQGYGRRDIPHEPISAILDILGQKKTPSIGCGHSVVDDRQAGDPEYSIRRSRLAHFQAPGGPDRKTSRAEPGPTSTHGIVPSRRCVGLVPLLDLHE